MFLIAIIATLQGLRRRTVKNTSNYSVPSSQQTALHATRAESSTQTAPLWFDYSTMCFDIQSAQKEIGPFKNATSKTLQSGFLPTYLSKTIDYVCNPDEKDRETALGFVLKNGSIEFRNLIVKILGVTEKAGALMALTYISEHDPAMDEREIYDPLNAQLDYYDREREKFYPIRDAARQEIQKKKDSKG